MNPTRTLFGATRKKNVNNRYWGQRARRTILSQSLWFPVFSCQQGTFRQTEQIDSRQKNHFAPCRTVLRLSSAWFSPPLTTKRDSLSCCPGTLQEKPRTLCVMEGKSLLQTAHQREHLWHPSWIFYFVHVMVIFPRNLTEWCWESSAATNSATGMRYIYCMMTLIITQGYTVMTQTMSSQTLKCSVELIDQGIILWRGPLPHISSHTVIQPFQ